MIRTFFTNAQFRTGVAGFVLAAAVCLQPLGFVLHSPAMHKVGTALAISPLQRPFHDVHGYEHYMADRTYTFTYTNGDVETFTEADARSLGTLAIDGPHKRKIVFMQTVAMWPRIPTVLANPVLNYFFCSSAVLPRRVTEAEMAGEVMSVAVQTVVHTASRPGQQYMRTIHCETE